MKEPIAKTNRAAAIRRIATTLLYNPPVDLFDPEFWKRLNPALSVSERPFDPRPHVEQFRAEGWFQTDPVLDVSSLRAAVESLAAAKLLPVFAFVYDEFWEVHRGAAVSALLSALLGPGYSQKPYVWIQIVDRASSSSGWPPHVDRDPPTEDISLWIPLTDATLDNGCMYLMPSYASRDDLQSIRALPAGAGSVLGWRQDLLHWGSYSSVRATEPRISIALEFDRGGGIDPRAPLPSLEERLNLIAKQILKYLEEFEPGRYDEKWLELADRIIARSSGPGR